MSKAKWLKFYAVSCLTLLIASAAWAADWPQWRGPHSDNKVIDFTSPKTWPKSLTKKSRVSGVGQGESSPILVGDNVYAFGRVGGNEVTMCLDAATGKEIWRDKGYAAAKVTGSDSQYPGPRSTPVVSEGK